MPHPSADDRSAVGECWTRSDREQKRVYYQQLDSLQEYVLVAQDRRRIEVWRRTATAWIYSVAMAGQVFELPSLGFAFAIDELYDVAGVDVR